MTVRNLLLAAQRNNVTSRFLFLGSDGWADRSDVVAGLEETAVGGLSIKIQSSYVEQFDDYYFKLHPDTNTRNPWFREFWQSRFNCSLPGVQESDDRHPEPCSGSQSLKNGYKQDTKMAFVMKAIYTMAWGLHNMQRDLCHGMSGLCNAMVPINGSLYRDYLMNVTFSSMNETVSFDSHGDPPGRYNIMNYQRLENGSFDYVRVGIWDNGSLVVHEDKVVFKFPNNDPPTSVCSAPCKEHQYKSLGGQSDGTQQCCWSCIDCDQDEYLKNETACEKCEPGYWPTDDKTGCEAIPVKHVMWSDAESIVALCLASLGGLATCFTMVVFIRYNHTPVVKASTRELSYIIFVGMMVSYLATIPLLARPSPLSCAVSRILPGLSFSMIYAALITKTNRIARILAGNKKILTRKPRFMSATAQMVVNKTKQCYSGISKVVITCILISIEVGIITTMLILDKPDVKHTYPGIREVKLVCNTLPRGIMAPMGWDFFLIAMCTVYAVKTRNLPENFNEAKFIGFSMYTTCVIWMAWVPIYFGSDHKIICMSVCTSLSALVTLVLLFFPKIYIILFRPEKNDRSAFKTTTTVRCHIGSGNKASLSRTTERTPSAAVESMYVGSAMLGIGQPQLSLMQRIRSTLGMPFLPPVGILPGEAHPRSLLRREISVWSDVSGSGGQAGGNAVNQNRDIMLRKAYGSQLDLAGVEGWREERSCQTTDDLLDPLIPRLRRRVARAVRENELEVAEGREFFSLTHSWMTSQAEAARSVRNRHDSQGTDEERPITTTIIREDLQTRAVAKEDPGEGPRQEKEKSASEPEEKPGAEGKPGSPRGTEDPPSDKGGGAHGEGKGEKRSEGASQDESGGASQKSPGHGSAQEVREVSPLAKDKPSVLLNKVVEEEEEEDCCDPGLQQKCSAVGKDYTVLRECSTEPQIGDCIGYGSLMPCSPSWKRQRSVSCDNSIIYKKNRVRPFDQATQTDRCPDTQGWIPNGDPSNSLVLVKANSVNDNAHRKRKVGISAKVSDVRGILKTVSFSPAEKENRVSFNSVVCGRNLSRGDELISQESSDEDTEGDSQERVRYVRYRNPVCAEVASGDVSSRIREETLSADSDISDNCELKSIIIKLGCEEDEPDAADKAKSGKNGNIINWRPKLGKNHKLLSQSSDMYEYDTPSATEDEESVIEYPRSGFSNSLDVKETEKEDPDCCKRYSRDNELVILDLLHNTFVPKYQGSQISPDLDSPQCSSAATPPSVCGGTPGHLSPVSQSHFTITPPEYYRNSPTKHASPPESSCSSSQGYGSPQHPCRQDAWSWEASEAQPEAEELTPTASPRPGSSPPVAYRGSHDNPMCCPDEDDPMTKPPGHGSRGAIDPRLARHDTDDDTDESTTPLEEFFRTHGVKFDTTSNRPKKL
nr:uncharacterized protein LOC113809201 isoform X1 [Penaeus vannamei]